MPRSFRSDNNAGITDDALRAIAEANEGHAKGYGDDEWTARAVAAFRDLFDAPADVHLVATGTAANCLALACLTSPWQRTLCHSHAHLNDDESTAPEFYTSTRVTVIEPGNLSASVDQRFPAPIASKLTPDDVRRAARAVSRGDVHQPAPGALTLSNPTEFGEVYTSDELRDVARVAHEHGFRVHVDGARFANAVAAVLHTRGRSIDDRAAASAAARALTLDAGVDALSFGGTKNGLALGEAVVFFSAASPSPLGGEIDTRSASGERLASSAFPWLRKRAAHLLSKHRFVAAPFARTIESGSWLASAHHANTMARALADGLRTLGVHIPYAVDANGVFAQIAPDTERALIDAGFGFYMFGDPTWR
ncbi:MAG: threonine aldolase family protein, partial [Phycisphaerales bacterium]